jgi:hypothetical protein
LKNKTLIFIVVILAVVSGIFLMKDRFSTFRPELKDFAVKDTASITKIFLANRSGKQVLLEKKGPGHWTVDKKYDAKYFQVRLLLDGISKVAVRTPVSKQGYNSVLRQLSSNSIKCEIYTNGDEKPEKVYYVGGATEDAMGTFMMIEGSSTPFITEIPGFSGYLTPRYSVDISDWRETALFRIPLSSIKSFSVRYTNSPENSFVITNENGKLKVQGVEQTGSNSAIQQDSIAVQNYLALLESVNVETWIKEMRQGKKDSITSAPPAITISLTEQNGSVRSIDLYPMPLTERSLTQTDEHGQKLKYDLDKMYGIVNPGKLWSSVQHFNIDRILRRLSDFDVRRNTNIKPGVPAI